MKFIFRPASRVAMYLKKRCQIIALEIAGGGVINRIEDGFIIRVMRSGDTAIADVLETPALFVGSRRDYNMAGRRPPWGFVYGDRGSLAAQVTPGEPPVAVIASADNTKLYEVPGYTYVGHPPEVINSPANLFPPMTRASVVGQSAHIGSLLLASDPGANSGYHAYLDVVIASWRTPATSYAEYPRGVEAVTSGATQRLIVSDAGVQGILGPETFIGTYSAHLRSGLGIPGFRSAAATGVVTVPDDPNERPIHGVITALPVTLVGGRDVTGYAFAATYGLLVARVDIAEPDDKGLPQSVPPSWWHLLYSGERFLSDLGIASDGAVATLVAASYVPVRGDTGGGTGIIRYDYSVELSWFDGGLSGSAVVHTESISAASVAAEFWLAVGEVAGGVAMAAIRVNNTNPGAATAFEMDGTARLVVCRAGVVTPSNLHTAGWRIYSNACRGQLSVFNDGTGVNDPIKTSAIADIGDGHVAVIAAPSAQLINPVSGTASWSLVVLDSETLEFVEARAVVASLFYRAGEYSSSGQSISLTVIAQQSRNDDGVITEPAVLLATISATWESRWLMLSRDGGATWQRIREGQPPGDTFYIGNKLHPVEIGVSL